MKDKNNIFYRLLCLNFGSKFLARHVQYLLYVAHIASDFSCVYCTVAGTIFGTTDVYELNSVFPIFLLVSLGKRGSICLTLF